MLCGIPPFYNENIEKMYELIKFAELRFPKKIKISPDAQNLIMKVLSNFNFFNYSYLIEIQRQGLERKMG